MKRTPFQRGNKQLKKTGFLKINSNPSPSVRKPLKPLKRSGKLKKKSKVKTSVLKRKLWDIFSKYIRTRDKGVCFVCGVNTQGKAYHASHFIAKAIGGLTLYFHEENVHGCCYFCNIFLGGNLWEYGLKLGPEKVKELYDLKQKSVKWSENDYLEKINHYTNLLQ